MSASDSVPVYRPTRPPLIATFREVRAFVERRLPGPRREPPAFLAPAPPGAPAALVLPTLLRDDRQTRFLRAAIGRSGFAAFGWELGRNMGPTPALVAGAEARLLALAGEHGPVSLVGLSMGGLFCRWLAYRHPEQVRRVITVCSPFRAPLDSFFLPLRPVTRLWAMPGLAEMATAVEQPLSVPTCSLYSRRDGIVAWESCHNAPCAEEHIAIDSYHVGIAVDPTVQSIIIEQLSRDRTDGSKRCNAELALHPTSFVRPWPTPTPALPTGGREKWKRDRTPMDKSFLVLFFKKELLPYFNLFLFAFTLRW